MLEGTWPNEETDDDNRCAQLNEMEHYSKKSVRLTAFGNLAELLSEFGA